MLEEFIDEDGFVRLVNAAIGGYGVLIFLQYDYLMALSDLNTVIQSFLIGYILFLGIHLGLSLSSTEPKDQRFSAGDIVFLTGVCLGALRVIWALF